VVSGWSAETTWVMPGGIRWKEPETNRSRNTCVNGPAAELALRLHDKTGEASYLDRAGRIYDWARHALLRGDGLYVDQIAPDGTRNPTIWSYNQGTMVGAGVLLARQTGDPSFLDHAVATATAFLGGTSATQLMTQDPAFNAVFFRNLLTLDRERPDPRYRSLAFDYGAHMWETKRLRHGLFAGQGSPLNNAAAMVQIYALLAGAAPHP
jgi:rhamnogalacturonyl hydrolase YesR